MIPPHYAWDGYPHDYSIIAIYNSLDGNAKSIKVTVDLVHASFSVTDDGATLYCHDSSLDLHLSNRLWCVHVSVGVGIDPDGLYEHVGECCGMSQPERFTT